MERDAFLARARTAARAAHLPDVDAGRIPVGPEPDAGDLVARFVDALGRVGGVAHRDDPAAVILRLAEAHGVTEYLGWDDAWLPPGLGDALRDGGLGRIHHEVPSSVEGRRRHQLGYFDVVLGVTGAEAAFGETGTVVLRSGPGRPRMASLIPEIHVVVLRCDDIHPDLSRWAATPEAAVGDAANVVFVTGPSRTGDIEMRLNVGVHGPREVHVVLV